MKSQLFTTCILTVYIACAGYPIIASMVAIAAIAWIYMPPLNIPWLVWRITGRSYYYRVHFQYRNKSGIMIFGFYRTQWVIDRRYVIDEEREMKKVGWSNSHKDPGVKKLLCNGYFAIENISYLGWLKPPAPKAGQKKENKS